MRIKFKASINFNEYHGVRFGERIDFRDGEEREVGAESAQSLLIDFPANFEAVSRVETTNIEAPPVDRMMKKGKARK